MSSLRALKLVTNELQGTIPDTITQLVDLEVLWLSGNRLESLKPLTYSTECLIKTVAQAYQTSPEYAHYDRIEIAAIIE